MKGTEEQKVRRRELYLGPSSSNGLSGWARREGPAPPPQLRGASVNRLLLRETPEKEEGGEGTVEKGTGGGDES